MGKQSQSSIRLRIWLGGPNWKSSLLTTVARDGKLFNWKWPSKGWWKSLYSDWHLHRVELVCLVVKHPFDVTFCHKSRARKCDIIWEIYGARLGRWPSCESGLTCASNTMDNRTTCRVWLVSMDGVTIYASEAREEWGMRKTGIGSVGQLWTQESKSWWNGMSVRFKFATYKKLPSILDFSTLSLSTLIVSLHALGGCGSGNRIGVGVHDWFDAAL